MPRLPRVSRRASVSPARARATRRTYPREEKQEDGRSFGNPFRAYGRIVRPLDGTAVPRRHGDAHAKYVPPDVGIGENVAANVALLVIDAVGPVERIQAAGRPGR